MRVLLDENVDRRLKQSFGPEHEVVTVRERGWHGTRNGELLRAAASELDVMVTLDTNLQHQQNLLSLDLAIVLVTARDGKRQTVERAMPEVNRLLPTVRPGQLYVVAA